MAHLESYLVVGCSFCQWRPTSFMGAVCASSCMLSQVSCRLRSSVVMELGAGLGILLPIFLSAIFRQAMQLGQHLQGHCCCSQPIALNDRPQHVLVCITVCSHYGEMVMVLILAKTPIHCCQPCWSITSSRQACICIFTAHSALALCTQSQNRVSCCCCYRLV